MAGSFPQVRRLENAAALRARLDELGTELPVADVVDAAGALAQPLSHPGGELANRFCILPMEGWDGTTDGRPTDLVRRRWSRFGSSGAALMWGGEAVAVDPAGQSFNPELHQAMAMVDSPEHAPNAVVQVMQKGYTLNGRLLRPAMVVVAKPAPRIDETA